MKADRRQVRGFRYSEAGQAGISGVPSSNYFRGFTSRSMNDLFLRAGFSLEGVHHVRQPIFGSRGVLPSLERKNFHTVVAEIEADSLSDVYQFIVKAAPSSMTGGLPGSGSGTHTTSEESAKPLSDITQPVSIVGPEASEDSIDGAVLQLGRELEAERAMRRELLAALEEAGASAAAFERRLHEMTSRRIELETAKDQTAAIQAAYVEELQAQVANYEKDWSALYLELEDARTQAADLKTLAGQREAEIQKASRGNAREQKGVGRSARFTGRGTRAACGRAGTRCRE